MRFGTFTAVVVLLSSAIGACSLVLPYDEYPGIAPAADGGTDTVVDSGPAIIPAPVDGGSIVEVIDGGGEVPAACVGINLMTSADNCGACGRRCVDGTCANGRCEVKTLTLNGQKIVLSLDVKNTPGLGDTLYITRDPETLQRLPLADGGKVEGSTKAKPVGPAFVMPNGASGIYVGDASVWLFRTNNFADDPPDRIFARSNLGPVLLAGDRAYFGDGTGLLWAAVKKDSTFAGLTPTSPPRALAAHDSRVFWVTANGDVLAMVASNPATDPQQVPAIVSTGITTFTCLAVSSAHLYLGNPGQGVIVYDYDANTAKGTSPRLVPISGVQNIATDDAHVYAVDYYDDHARIVRMNLDGKEPTVLADDRGQSKALTIAGDYVYFSNGGVIKRTSK